jgi:hypothetical protein
MARNIESPPNPNAAKTPPPSHPTPQITNAAIAAYRIPVVL